MLQLSGSLLSSFSHMYWMDGDVLPARPHWLDRLSEATAQDDFWMKGSRHRGKAFDGVVQDAASLPWISHMHGAALYRLHDADFSLFLRLAMERELGDESRKPFDVCIWRAMYLFPYSWHLYQAYGEKLVTTALIQHRDFALRPHELSDGQQASAAYLLHGDHGLTPRVGDAHFSVLAAAIERRDEVPAAANISVFMRASAAELPFAELSLLSAKRFFPGALEYVVVVPQRDMKAAKSSLPSFAAVRAERDVLGLLSADEYCTGRFVFHLRSDAVLYRPALMRDLFVFHKPLIAFDRYPNVDLALGLAGGVVRSQQQQAAVSQALGAHVELAFSRADIHLFPREIYSRARQHALDALASRGQSLTALSITGEVEEEGRASTGWRRLSRRTWPPTSTPSLRLWLPGATSGRTRRLLTAWTTRTTL